MTSLIGELKRRNVFRVAAAYALVAWIMVQIGEAIFPAFGVPDALFRGMVIILVLAFPVVLVLAWVYEMTPEGIKRERDIDRSKSITPDTGRKLDRLIIVVLLLAVVVLLADKFVLQHESATEEPTAATAQEPGVADQPLAKSVAVLPFADMSPAGDQAYFADGLADSLLHALAQLNDLRVAARTSSFAFKGKNIDVRNIGEQLGVATILEGSVQKSGNRLRVITQLIDVADGTHLWSETFDRTDEDVFAIQDEISAAVVKALQVTLLEGEAERLSQRVTNDVAAFDLYLLGRHEFHKRTPVALAAAIDFFERAIVRDENFVPAYTGLADSWMLLSENNYGKLTVREAASRAKPYIERALAIDPESSEANASLGLYLGEFRLEGEFEGTDSVAALERAIELNPGNALAHLWLSIDYQGMGRYQDSMNSLQRAYALDPLNTNLLLNMSWWAMMRGRDDDARNFVARTIEVGGKTARFLEWQAFLEIFMGRADAALGHALEAARTAPENVRFATTVVFACQLLEAEACEAHWLARAGELAPQADDVLASRAFVAERQGRLDEAAVIGEQRLEAALGPGQQWENLTAREAARDLATVYAQQGRYSEAVRLFERVYPELTATLGRNDIFNARHLATMAWAYRNLEQPARETAALAEARKRVAMARNQGIKHWSVELYDAIVQAQLGFTERAEELLEAAVERGYLGMNRDVTDRLGDILGDSLRYRQAMARIEDTVAGQRENAPAD